MDSLDYGRRFILDGRLPRGSRTHSRGEVEKYLLELHARLEGRHAPGETVVVEDDDGLTAAIRGAEAHVVLHLFPRLARLSLFVFTRRDVLLSDLTRDLGMHFDVGRFDSHLGNAAKALPKEADRLRRTLAGDRSYARIRLDDNLLVP
jgi:hypothetical protein